MKILVPSSENKIKISVSRANKLWNSVWFIINATAVFADLAVIILDECFVKTGSVTPFTYT